jgi:hypothetical protein
MALRKYNAVRGGDAANHTSDGFIVPKRGSGSVLPPPDDGFLYMASGPYWVGPMFFTTIAISPPSGMMEMIVDESGYEPITAAIAGTGGQKVIGWGPSVNYYPMFGGME